MLPAGAPPQGGAAIPADAYESLGGAELDAAGALDAALDRDELFGYDSELTASRARGTPSFPSTSACFSRCHALLQRGVVRAALVLLAVLVLLACLGGLLLTDDAAPPAPSPPPPPGPGWVVINTWWSGTAAAAVSSLQAGHSALEAAQAACAATEESRAFGDRTVGPDGSPDSAGETTLDALLQDGDSLRLGAVAYLRRVPSAIAAARSVLLYTEHSMLAGDGATALATSLGGQTEQSLTGNASAGMYAQWRAASCQPNFYNPLTAVGANSSCPPYTAALRAAEGGDGALRQSAAWASEEDHDTVGVCVRDGQGRLAVGVSSNGANHKVAGRVGDAPIPGAGGYADSRAGCAACTGDGDITMRFLPSYQAVEFMRSGMSAQQACEAAVRRIMEVTVSFSIGLVCLDRAGRTGSASHGWGGSAFSSCEAEAGRAGPNCTRLTALTSGELNTAAADDRGALRASVKG